MNDKMISAKNIRAKKIATKVKNNFDELIRRMDIACERINKCNDKGVEIIPKEKIKKMYYL